MNAGNAGIFGYQERNQLKLKHVRRAKIVAGERKNRMGKFLEYSIIFVVSLFFLACIIASYIFNNDKDDGNYL